MLSKGSWWLNSETDPRWNTSGTAKCCGGFAEPIECKAAREQLEKKLGKPPEDLEWGYMKD